MQFKAKDFTPRTAETYDYHCSLLDGPLSAEDSITYGINYESPLNEIENFHVINQLPQDIMHVLLEGVIPYEISLLLTKFIVYQKYFSADHLNDRIACFSYSIQEARDKPSPIKGSIFTSRYPQLNQSGKLNCLLVILCFNRPLV